MFEGGGLMPVHSVVRVLSVALAFHLNGELLNNEFDKTCIRMARGGH